MAPAIEDGAHGSMLLNKNVSRHAQAAMKSIYFLPAPAIATLYLIVLGFSRQLTLDHIVKSLYRDHRSIWESLHKPCGCWWSAPGRIAVPWNLFTFQWKWYKQDPEWLPQTPELAADFECIRSLQRRTFWIAPIVVGLWIVFGALNGMYDSQ